MKNFINFCEWTHRDICFIVKLIFSAILNKISIVCNNWKNSQLAQNILCKHPYILYTPFGNYYMESLEHYYMCTENFEPEIQDVIKEESRKFNDETYLINIWCNIWRYAIWLAKKYKCNVLAFEPTPRTYNNLKINIYLSNLANKITTYNIWLWDENRDMFFEVWDLCDSCAHIVYKKNKNTITIPVKRFDDLWIEKEKIGKTRLVIMDVEWFELNVLRWMKNTLQLLPNDTKLIIEILQSNNDKEEIFSFMRDLWYSNKNLDENNYIFYKE